jgi:hypothetical protein
MVPDEHGDRPSSECTSAQAISQRALRIAALKQQVTDLRAPTAPPPLKAPPTASKNVSLTKALALVIPLTPTPSEVEP